MNFIELIKEMKLKGHGLMSEAQYLNAGYVVDILSPCNFLIFGLGQDATIWSQINSGGRTVFLEDDQDWISEFANTELEIYPVTYATRAEDHEQIGFNVANLQMDLPSSITDVEWDVIFVDGPLGHNPPRPYKGPGRMQSIYTAHSLLKEYGICIIDDMGRLIESKYAAHFFGKKNLYNIIENKVGIFKKRPDDE